MHSKASNAAILAPSEWSEANHIMRIRHLAIRRFRGIRELDWSVRGQMICLIGQGDSTKSTILNALGHDCDMLSNYIRER